VSKRLIISICILCLIASLCATSLQENLEQLAKENGKKYLQPLANTAGAGLNSGLYNSARVLKPFMPNIKMGVAFVSVPDGDKTYDAVIGDDTIKDTATIFGDIGKPIANTGATLPDGADLSTIPIPHITASIGLPFGNEVMVRYLAFNNLPDEVGKINLWGVGLKHSVDQYLTEFFPVDLSVQGVYQSLTVGDIVTVNALSANVQASKKILMLTLYGGLGIESSNLKVNYKANYKDIDEEASIIIGSPVFIDKEAKVNLDIDAENSVKMTVGLRITPFPFFDIYGDYSIANYSSFNAGIGIGF